MRLQRIVDKLQGLADDPGVVGAALASIDTLLDTIIEQRREIARALLLVGSYVVA